MLTKDAKTLLKGGVGLFYDRVPLNIASFPYLPDRTIVNLGPTGQILDSEGYVNTITAGLRNPRSVGWNVELDRQVTSALTIRAGFQQRDTSRDFLLTPETLIRSRHPLAFERWQQLLSRVPVAGVYKIRGNTLNASYVRSKAYGDLNDFNQFFGNNAVAVIEPNERGRLPFDAPNRFLFWGQWKAPFKLTRAAGFRSSHRISIFAGRSIPRFHRASGLTALSPLQFLRPASDQAGQSPVSAQGSSRRALVSASSTCSIASILVMCKTTSIATGLTHSSTEWAEHSAENLFWSSNHATQLVLFEFSQ